jgi:hypothetical protein
MAMVHHNIHSLFGMIKFHQPGSTIKAKAEEKIKLLNAKIEERKKRIAKIRTDHKITDADLVELLSEKARNQFAQQGSYTLCSNSIRGQGKERGEEITIAAGVINNFNTENNLIGQEQEHAERLALLARNIDVNIKHEVTFEELEYLML